MLRARLVTAAVAIPLLILIVFQASPWPISILILAIAAVGMAEFAGMAFPNQRFEKLFTVVGGTAIALAAAFPAPAIQATLAATFIVGLTWVLVSRPDFENGLRDLGLALVGILYVGFLLPHFILLHEIGPLGPRWVFWVIAIGMAGDTSGYFVGKSFGRHKLIPHVSPGKTVEGAVGILAGSCLIGVLFNFILQLGLTPTTALLLSGVMGIIGQIGDLTESVIKRAFGSKESGWIIPGHGGVLDRIDSLLFPLVFLYYHLMFVR